MNSAPTAVWSAHAYWVVSACDSVLFFFLFFITIFLVAGVSSGTYWAAYTKSLGETSSIAVREVASAF